MSFTYTSDLVNSPTDWIRFVIGDTSVNNVLTTDEELQALLTLYNTKERAAKYAMEGILSKYAERADHKIGTTSVAAGKLYENYKKRYDDYVKEYNKAHVEVPAIHETAPNFWIGMHDWSVKPWTQS